MGQRFAQPRAEFCVGCCWNGRAKAIIDVQRIVGNLPISNSVRLQ